MATYYCVKNPGECNGTCDICPVDVDPRQLELPPPLQSIRLTSDGVVSRPAHYTRWEIEPVSFIMRNKMEFWRGNIIKYVCRAGYKIYDGKDEVESEITDLEKIRRYAEMRIRQLRGEVDIAA